MPRRQEFRLVIERDLGPTESRVAREERPISTETAARELARWCESPLMQDGTHRWVETRTVTDWEELGEADAARRGAG